MSLWCGGMVDDVYLCHQAGDLIIYSTLNVVDPWVGESRPSFT